MKRLIAFTAAAIRLAGLWLFAVAVLNSFDFSVSVPTRAITTYHSSLHFLGFDVFVDAHLGTVLVFVLKMSAGVAFIFLPRWFAQLFWRGIAPKNRSSLMSSPYPELDAAPARKTEEERETDIWSDQL